MTTMYDYVVIPPGRCSIVQLLANSLGKKESEIIKMGAEELHCPANSYIWLSHYVECRELPARLVIWAIDKMYPSKDVVV